MKVELPFSNDVILNSLPHFHFYLGILAGQQIDINAFLFHHFIHISYFNFSNHHYVDFPGVLALFRLFRRQTFPYDLPDPVNFVKENLNQGRYLQIFLNLKYITSLNISRDFVHNFLVYGYDDEKQIFLISGHVRDTHISASRIKNLTISYKELIDSYRTTNRKSEVFTNNYTIYIRKKPKHILCKKKVRRTIFIYRHNLLPSLHNICFNRNTYTRLQNTIKYAIANHQKYAEDLRTFKTLQGRFRILLNLEQFLNMSVDKQKKCEDILEDLTTALVFSTVINTITKECPEQNNMDALNTLYNKFEKIKIVEDSILKDIYNELKKK